MVQPGTVKANTHCFAVFFTKNAKMKINHTKTFYLTSIFMVRNYN